MYEVKHYDIHGRGILEIYGFIIENIVYLELFRRGDKVYAGKVGEYEADFIAINSNQEANYNGIIKTNVIKWLLTRKIINVLIWCTLRKKRI